MNIYQRIVLLLGAIALIFVIWTSPKYVTIKGSRIRASNGGMYATSIDYSTVMAKSIGVIGSTLFIFFTLKGIGKKEGK